MYKVEAWIERVQTEYLFSREFSNLEDAQRYLKKDFLERSKDAEFMQHGGYDIYEMDWKRMPRPKWVVTPSLEF